MAAICIFTVTTTVCGNVFLCNKSTNKGVSNKIFIEASFYMKGTPQEIATCILMENFLCVGNIPVKLFDFSSNSLEMCPADYKSNGVVWRHDKPLQVMMALTAFLIFIIHSSFLIFRVRLVLSYSFHLSYPLLLIFYPLHANTPIPNKYNLLSWKKTKWIRECAIETWQM